MKIRIFAVLLVAFLFVGVFAGCAPGKIPGAGSPSPGNSTAGKDPTGTQTASPNMFLTGEQAEAIALQHAGLTRDQVRMDRTEPEPDEHIPHFEVEFSAGGWEYDYEIHAQTGAVLKSEKEPQGQDAWASTGPPVTTAASITAAEAEEIALQHAGLTRDQVRMDRTEPELDEHIPHFEVEFSAGGWEYDYEIHAQTGEILKSEKEPA